MGAAELAVAKDMAFEVVLAMLVAMQAAAKEWA